MKSILQLCKELRMAVELIPTWLLPEPQQTQRLLLSHVRCRCITLPLTAEEKQETE